MREDLVKELLNIIGDYNMSQGLIMDENHIKKWIDQFDEEYRDLILKELIHIFKSSYISRARTKEYIESVLTSKEVFGDDIENNIKNTTFLRIQRSGNSQNDLLEIVEEVLLETYGVKIDDCESDERFFYIDDCIFTGNKFKYDIKEWLETTPIKEGSKIISYHIGVYKHGEKYTLSALEDILNEKEVELYPWWHLEFNNYKSNRFNTSKDFLFPKEIEEESVQAYIQDRYDKSTYAENIEFFRDYDLQVDKFCSSKQARECLETEFLKVGADLVMSAENYSNSVRPMGFSKLESIGFGSMFITYRNISNNCPLALWYGDINAGDYTPLGKWYPLFPRVTSNDHGNVKPDLSDLAQIFT